MDLGLTQREAATQIGVSPFTLIHWERGQTRPEICAWPGLIAFLGCDPISVDDSVSEQLLAIRRRRGLPQSDLACEFGVDPGTLSRWELGVRVPRGRFREQIEGMLGADPKPGRTTVSLRSLPSTIGDHLRAHRRQRRLSQEVAAGLLGVSPPTLSRWECGRTQPARSFRRQIVAFLGYDPR